MNAAFVLADPAYSTLKEFVLDRTALHYYSEKDEDLATRFARRMTARNAKSCATYLDLLRNAAANESEWDALVGEITIGETYFFRQSEHFDFLRTTIIPDVLQRNRESRKLRIWSAGCAIGAEPYSISLLLKLMFADQLRDWNVSILATDINVQFLAQARSGRFGEWALRRLPDSMRQCCFRKSGAMWELAPEYRNCVRFEYHNLAGDSPCPSSLHEPIDIIMCRNVLIYFSGERIRQVAQGFYDSMAPLGWLLVGHAEPSATNFPRFQTVVGEQTTAYRKGVEQPLPQAPRLNLDAWPFVPEASPTVPASATRLTVPSGAKPQLPAPEPAVSLVETARALADKGEWDSAGMMCRDLLRQNALNAAAHFTLGLVLQHSGATGEAETSLRRAIYLDRRFALAHYHLGLSLQNTRKKTQARKAFQNTLELLSALPDDELLPHGDGIRAAELRELVQMHLELTS